MKKAAELFFSLLFFRGEEKIINFYLCVFFFLGIRNELFSRLDYCT